MTLYQNQTAIDNPNYAIIIQQKRKDNTIVEVIGSMPEDIRMSVHSEWEAPLANGILGMLPGAINGMLRMYGVKPATQAMTLQVWQGNTSDQDFTLDLVFATYSDPARDIRRPLLDLLSFISPSVDESGIIQSPGPTIKEEAAGKLVAGGIAMSAKITVEALKTGGSTVGSIAGAVGGGAYSKDDAQKTVDATTKSLAQMVDDKALASMPKMDEIKGMINNQIAIQIGNFLYFDSVIIIDVQPDCDLSFLDGQSGYPNVVKVSVTFRPLFMLTAADWESVFMEIPEEPPQQAEVSRVAAPTTASVKYDPETGEALRTPTLPNPVPASTQAAPVVDEEEGKYSPINYS